MPVECYTSKGKKRRKLFGSSNPKHQENKKYHTNQEEINQICNVPRADKNEIMNLI